MQKEFMFFDKKIEISSSYIRLLLITFAIALLSKGAIIFRGFSVDDYLFSRPIDPSAYDFFFGQGRYGVALIFWIFNSLGINISDMYFPCGILALFFYSAFVVSILRFVGMDKSRSAALAGAIMIAHPYLIEIFTFRVALPTLSVTLIFCIIALEMLIKNPISWKTRAVALLATLAMLFTYQIFLSYFAVAIIFAFLYGQIFYSGNQVLATENIYRQRAIALAIISMVAGIIFVVTLRLSKAFGVYIDARNQLIGFDEISARIELMLSTLKRIYWSAEPIFPETLKILVAAMLVASLLMIFWYLFRQQSKSNAIKSVFLVICAFLLLLPITLSVVILFENWWPAFRIVSHVAIIIGLTFLIADDCIQTINNAFLKSILFVSKILVLVGFVLLNNQILADQQRINEWDKMMANRIIARLEIHPDFDKIKFIYVCKGGDGAYYPNRLRTRAGDDMNMSAFAAIQSKDILFSELSGYNFSSDLRSTPNKITTAEAYCATKKPWPHAESITIDDDLAIISLKK